MNRARRVACRHQDSQMRMYRTSIIAVVLKAALFLGACAGQPESEIEEEAGQKTQAIAATPAETLLVYSSPTKKSSFGENDTDFRNMLEYMARQPYKPDLIALTETKVDTNDDRFHWCSEFVTALKNKTGDTTYNHFRTAARGGACLVYRGGRFEPWLYTAINGSSTTWTVVPGVLWNGSSCYNGTINDEGNSLVVGLRDKVANRYLTVAAVHFPTDHDQCTLSSFIRVQNHMSNTGSHILLGDVNNETNLYNQNAYASWYTTINGNLSNDSRFNWSDIVMQQCWGDHQCQRNNWTVSSGKRIDVVLFRWGIIGEGNGAKTVGFGDVNAKLINPDKNYSDHRTIQAVLRWN